MTLSPNSLLPRLRRAAVRFVTAPASPLPLAVFRVGVAAVLVGQSFWLAGDLFHLYGPNAVVQWSALFAEGESVPLVARLLDAASRLGVAEYDALRGLFMAYVAALGLLLIGWQTRVSAALACLAHAMLNAAGPATIYGVDHFAQIALFYCAVMPVGGALSVDRSHGAPPPSDFAVRLSLRTLQLHLCLAYFATGVEKAMGAQWWNGEAIWRALMLPSLAQFDFGWLAAAPWLAVLMCWGTLAVELGYPVLVWFPRTRVPVVLAVVGLHLGIGLAMSLVSFSAVMVVLSTAAFLVPSEPRAATERAPQGLCGAAA